MDKALGKGTSQPGLHATIEITPDRGQYLPGQDEPRYLDKRGPRCYDFKDFPKPFPQNPPDGPLKDGTTPPPAAKTAGDGAEPEQQFFNGDARAGHRDERGTRGHGPAELGGRDAVRDRAGRPAAWACSPMTCRSGAPCSSAR